jgi:hypothetical protein
MALRETLLKGWWGFGVFFVPHAIYRYFVNSSSLRKIDMPSFRDPEVVTLSQYPFRIPQSPFKEPAPLIASAIALIIIGAFIFSGSSSSSSYTTPSMYFGEVGSCYKEVTSAEGEQIQMVKCTDSAATLRSISVVQADYLCPTNALYTTVANLPDGTVKTACLERI